MSQLNPNLSQLNPDLSQFNPIEVAQKWNEMIEIRRLQSTALMSPTSVSPPPVLLGDGGKYQKELDTAVLAVQSNAFLLFYI